MTAQENKEIVRHVLNELFNNQNLGVVDEYLAPDYVDHKPAPGKSPDRAGVKQFFAGMAKAFSDIRLAIEDQIGEGDKVVTRWTARYTHTGEFMGIPGTGKEVTFTAISIFRVVNGKLKEEWTEFDALGLFQQLGAAPGPEQVPAD